MSTSNNANMESCLEFASKIVNDKKSQMEYAAALQECRQNPAYHIVLKTGDQIPIASYPLMNWDTKGWNTVKRKIRVKKVKTEEQLDEEADLDNWEDVEHYGRVTYTNTAPANDHNGALFDIGSRF
jgi:hypothetical protein